MTPWVLRLIVANIVVYFLQQTVPGVGSLLAFVPAQAFIQPWTLVTYMFVHANVTHILFNMLALYFFGPKISKASGKSSMSSVFGSPFSQATSFVKKQVGSFFGGEKKK